jgi:N-acetylneuraminic acid mutarotase
MVSALNAQWIPISPYPGIPAMGTVSFVIGEKAYVGCGVFSDQMWEYTPATDTWKQVASIPGARGWAISFALNGKGYVGAGDPDYKTGKVNRWKKQYPVPIKEFYEYDPVADTWTKKADFTYLNRAATYHFVIGDQGYAGGGYSNLGTYKDLYSYNVDTDEWASTDYFYPEGNVRWPGFFVIDELAYIGTGIMNEGDVQIFHSFDVETSTWKVLADYPGMPRHGAASFVAGGKGYIGGGMLGDDKSPRLFNDFWGYDPYTDSWSELEVGNDTIPNATWYTAFVINNIAYVGASARMPDREGNTEFFKMDFGSLLETSTKLRTVNFGAKVVTQSCDTVITVKNGGSRPFTITAMDFSDPDGVYTYKGPALPVELATGQSFDITVSFTPTALTTSNATLTIVSNANNASTMDIVFTGRGRGPEALIELSTVFLSFGSVSQGSTDTRQLEISNPGETDLSVSDIVFLGNTSNVYSLPGLNLPIIVAPGMSHFLTVQFAPTSNTQYSGRIKIVSNAANDKAKICDFAGSGGFVSKTIDLNTTFIRMEGVEFGTYAEETFEIRNTGQGALTVFSNAIANDPYKQFELIYASGEPPFEIPAGGKHEVTVRFTPQGEGSFNADLYINSNADNGVQKNISLVGVGYFPAVSEIDFEPVPLDFGSILPSTSKEAVFQILSVGGMSLRIENLELDTNPDGVFSFNSISLPSTLTTGGKKSVTFNFEPKATGPFHGTIRILSNALGYEDVVIDILGYGATKEGVDATLSVSTVDFGMVKLSEDMSEQVTITSTGTEDLIVQSVMIDGIDASAFSYSNFYPPDTLKPGESATIKITYAPTSVGDQTAVLHLQSNMSGSPDIPVTLNGIGLDPTSVRDLPVVPSNPVTLYPNPVTEGGTIQYYYTGHSAQTADITVYDVYGRSVSHTVRSEIYPGAHTLALTAAMPVGIYYVSILIDGKATQIPLVVVSR